MPQRKFRDREWMHGDDGFIEQSFQVGILIPEVIDPDRGVNQDNHGSGAAARDGPEGFFSASQAGQAFAAFQRDKRLQSAPDKRGLLVYTRQTGRLTKHFIVNIECCSHAS